MPKMRGFSNARFKKHFNVVNLSQIETIAQSGVSEINLETLIKHNIVSKKTLPVKLL
jgi:ribosomal protein L15